MALTDWAKKYWYAVVILLIFVGIFIWLFATSIDAEHSGEKVDDDSTRAIVGFIGLGAFLTFEVMMWMISST